jgi:predicted O-methyltransferase YrrM
MGSVINSNGKQSFPKKRECVESGTEVNPFWSIPTRLVWFGSRPEPADLQSFGGLYEKFIDPIEGWMSRSECKALFTVATFLPKPARIVEIGSYQGRSTVSIALGLSKTQKIVSIDPHTGDMTQVLKNLRINTFDALCDNLRRAGVEQSVDVIAKMSHEAIDDYDTEPIDFLFIDGWHSYEAVSRDIRDWCQFLTPNGTVIFDDWTSTEICDAIRDNSHLLPKRLGAVGKLLIFTNHEEIRESNFGKFAASNYPRLLLISRVRSIIFRIAKKFHREFAQIHQT